MKGLEAEDFRTARKTTKTPTLEWILRPFAFYWSNLSQFVLGILGLVALLLWFIWLLLPTILFIVLVCIVLSCLSHC